MRRDKPDSLSEADGLKMPEARDVHEHSYVPAVSSAYRPAHGSSGVPMQFAGPDRQLSVVRPLRTSLPGPRLTLSSMEKICHTHGQRQWGTIDCSVIIDTVVATRGWCSWCMFHAHLSRCGETTFSRCALLPGTRGRGAEGTN